MNSTPSLTFDLIRTLEPAEKSYIKKQFSANEKNLKQLFDDLYKTKTYNKYQFKLKHKSKAYIKHLSQNKTYLRKKIIDALIQYNAKSIAQISQRDQLNAINILIHKGLLSQAAKLVEQGLQKNEHLEHYMHCYELCSLIANLSVHNVGYSLPKETLRAFKQKRRFYIRQLFLTQKFGEFSDIHYAEMSDQQKIVALKEKITELGLDNVDDLPEEYPFFAKRMFFYSKNIIAELQNNSISTLHLLEKCVNLYFKYPHFLQTNYTPFLTDSLNLLDNLQENAQFDTFFDNHKKILKIIEELSNNKIKNDFTTSYYVIKYYFYQLACTNSKQYQKAFAFSNEYLQFISDQKNLSDKFLAASRIAIAVAHLNVEQFEKIIDIINPIQSTKFYQYQYELRLIQILAHYRLENDLILDSLFDSFFYYLKKMEKKQEIKAIRVLKKCIEKEDFEALENIEFDELLSLDFKLVLPN